MPKRKTYYVNPSDDGWEVKGEGADRASRRFPTKAGAVEYGRSLARRQKPSQLKIRKGDGTFETEHTYGDDPFPPPG